MILREMLLGNILRLLMTKTDKKLA